MRSIKKGALAPGPASSPPLPSRPPSLNELVYAELRRQILWGEIAAGSTLSVRRLSEQFRVSPMPVRDAIRRLEVEDLVEVTPRSATRVSLVSPDAVREIAEVRSRFYGDAEPPASTLVGVQALVVPELLIEVEAIAVIDA